MRNFEDYLCDRNDLIDNTSYDLICALTAKNHHGDQEEDIGTPDWDMEIIGEVVDAGGRGPSGKGRAYMPSLLLRGNTMLSRWGCSNLHCVFRDQSEEEE